MQIAIVGGGAAGFFAAISAAESGGNRNEITILEGSETLLSKVKISGGGRCNVTNGLVNILGISNCYPRGKNSLKKVFAQFSFEDTVEWFKQKGVALKQEPDGRIFPVTDSSQTIVDCLYNTSKEAGVKIKTGFKVKRIQEVPAGFVLSSEKETLIFNKIIITCGGYHKIRNYEWLTRLGIEIEPPVPSLFTFNIKEPKLLKLMGVSVPNILVKIIGTGYHTLGDILITHWGLSGPAILKLSAFAARDLSVLDYHFTLQVGWICSGEIQVKEQLIGAIRDNPIKNITNKNPFFLPGNLWLFLLERSAINVSKKWNELGKKDLNRLINTLVNDQYLVSGKSTFKEEFVTCGGVKETEVDFRTMKSRKITDLFFAGEILNIDGVTGGFNFQAAWSTGYVAGKNVVK